MHLQEPLRQLKPNQLTDWRETQTCGKQYSGQKKSSEWSQNSPFCFETGLNFIV